MPATELGGQALAQLDVVYPVRPGERNEELRYSLRSLVNLPHSRVWLVGYCPSWVTGVEFIPGNPRIGKWLNVPENLRLACEHIDADRLLIMNDDFYITEPVDSVPSWCRGTLAEHIATTRGAWQRSLKASDRVLRDRGIDAPLSYEVHVPVVMERARLAEVLRHAGLNSGAIPAQWRTLYGNWWQVPAQPMPDVKIRNGSQPILPGAFLSSDPGTFRRVRKHLQMLFPEPSPYEQSVAVAA